MKKTLSIILALVMVFALCACGSKPKASTATDTGKAAASGSDVGATYVMLKDPISTEQYGIAFKKGNTALAKTVKEQLDAMWTDGTFKKIAETWGQGLPDMLCYDEAKVVTPAGSEEIAADASRKTLTLGFDAEYPLTAIRTTKETTSASTSTLPKKFASGLAGSSSSSPSIGIPRIWSSTPEISTSSGMA